MDQHKLTPRAIALLLVILLVLGVWGRNAWINSSNRPVRPDKPAVAKYHLLKFEADWCLSCRFLNKNIASTSVQKVIHANDVKVVTVHIDKDPKTAEAWDVTTAPVLILVEIDKRGKGHAVRRHDGGLNKNDLVRFVDMNAQWDKPLETFNEQSSR